MTSSPRQYTVAIIGAGRIGCGFDDPGSDHILTHAHAVSNHPRLRLGGLVDTDRARGMHEAARWSTAFFDSIEHLSSVAKPDVVIIASPDDTHVPLLHEISKLKPQLIVCEKPIALPGDDPTRIRSLIGTVPIIVNFSFRFDQTIRQIREQLRSGAYGKVMCATSVYTKGLFHNGSHVIDLARYFFGEMKSAQAAGSVHDIDDGTGSVYGTAIFEDCPQFHLVAADARQFAVFEFHIITERQVIRLMDEGLTIVTQDIVDDPVHAGFRVLGAPQEAATQRLRSLSTLADHVVRVLDGVEVPESSLENALKTHEACMMLAQGLDRS